MKHNRNVIQKESSKKNVTARRRKSFANYSDNASQLIYRVFRSPARARTFHLIIGMKIFSHLNLILFDTLKISREKRLSSVGGGRRDVTVACVDGCLISVCMIALPASQTQDFPKLRPAKASADYGRKKICYNLS